MAFELRDATCKGFRDRDRVIPGSHDPCRSGWSHLKRHDSTFSKAGGSDEAASQAGEPGDREQRG